MTSKDSAPIKEVIGRGKHKLVDTRPAERNGDSIASVLGQPTQGA